MCSILCKNGGDANHIPDVGDSFIFACYPSDIAAEQELVPLAGSFSGKDELVLAPSTSNCSLQGKG